MLRIAMDCSLITDFQQSTAIRIAKKFRNLHIGISSFLSHFLVQEKSETNYQKGENIF